MEVAGLALAIAPLAISCTKCIRIIQDVRTKYKRAPLTMASIASECSTVSVALSQLHYIEFPLSGARDGNGTINPVVQSLDAVMMGCTVALSLIEDHLTDFRVVTEEASDDGQALLGKMAKVKFVWNEDEVKELLQQLRGYQLNLTTLLSVMSRFGSPYSNALERLRLTT